MCYRFFVLFILLSISGLASADSIFNYSADTSKYLGKYSLFYEDVANKLTIDQVLDPKIKFTQSGFDVLNFGVTESTYWLQFKVANHSAYTNLILNVENPLLNSLTLYIVRPGLPLDSVHLAPGNCGVIDHQFFTFSLDIDKGETVQYILRAQTNTQMIIPVSIYSREGTISQMLSFDLRTGVFAGIMLAMLLYNLFLYFSARDKQYLYYVNYILWVTIAQLALLGIFYRFFASDRSILEYIVPFAGAMSGIASVIFARSFLNVKKYNTRFGFFLNAIIIGDLIAISLLYFDISLAYKAVNAVAVVGSVILLYIAYYLKRRGNKEANLFLLAWGIFLSSVIIFVLKDYGIVAYSQFSTYIVQLGASIEALLLSFALGNKINIYRKEKEMSQIREYNALRENERLIREQNENLEIKIEERTQELQIAYQSLESAMDELKEAQSQLVQSEKMASLGQLTAGVAHEINNPINFVTSNVKPLKRDLVMVWDAFDFIEKMALDGTIALEEKKVEIERYKKEIDIDYLKSEIDYLLRGMHDGASRTAEIVKSLRIFSRVDEDVVMRADVNLGIESTLVILSSLIGDKITLKRNLGNIPIIECYPGKLNQVLLNILTNAIYAIEKKFNGKPGGILSIESALSPAADVLEIIIEDNGVGMPEEVINKIFEPFFTTKDVGEGTGLGMSIAYNTIAKHKGSITVDSVVGEQTIFTIKIPVVQPA